MVHKMLFRSKISIQTANQIQIRFEPPSRKLSLKHAQFYMMQSLKSLLVHYSHGQELFYKFVSKITNKLVKQLLSMTVI